MKAFVAILFVVGAIAVVGFGLTNVSGGGTNNSDFLRLHIRANSNSHEDQRVKHDIRDRIVDGFAPIFAFVTSRGQAMSVLRDNLSRFNDIANEVLSEQGFTYTARTALRSEYFPTRSYAGFSLPAGMYDALIIELGAADGDNWWCVVYPPLCFLNNNIGGERGVVYRSRLQEIVGRFR